MRPTDNTSVTKLKKKQRDCKRLLDRELPPNIRVEKERLLETLNFQIEEKYLENISQKVHKRYKKVRFFELKKAQRKYKQQAESDEEKLEKHANLLYCQVFPLWSKYISLFVDENNSDCKDGGESKSSNDDISSERRDQILSCIRSYLKKSAGTTTSTINLQLHLENSVTWIKQDKQKLLSKLRISDLNNRSSDNKAVPDSMEEDSFLIKED